MKKDNLKVVCTYNGDEDLKEIILRSFHHYIKYIAIMKYNIML